MTATSISIRNIPLFHYPITLFWAFILIFLVLVPSSAESATGLMYQQAEGSDGLVSIEAEDYSDNEGAGDHVWAEEFTKGSSGTGTMESVPNMGVTRNSDYLNNSPRLDYQIQFVRSGKHFIWIRGMGPSGRDDSLHVGLDGAAVASADRISRFPRYKTGWSKKTMDSKRATIYVAEPGVHTVNVWMREDGFIFDKLVLTTNSAYVPTGMGPAANPTSDEPLPGGTGNTAPVISGAPSKSVAEGSSYRFAPSASDADGDDLTFSIVNRPSWASFDANTGLLSGTPGSNHVGTTSGIVITVSDGSASASLGPFGITVTNVNEAPVISGVPPGTVAEGSGYRFAPSASDADGDDLTFSIVNRPSWASFDANTGLLSGTPGSNYVGTTSGIVITVSDGSASASLSPFGITVTNVNEAPVISGIPPTSVAANALYHFAPSAQDPDEDTLTYGITNQPSWARFDPVTGVLQGTPNAGDVGTTSGIQISVTDGIATASLAAFDLVVTDSTDLAYQQAEGSNGLVSIEAEHYSGNVGVGDHAWVEVSPVDASGTVSMEGVPNTGFHMSTNFVGKSPRLDYRVQFVRAGIHYVWIRGVGATDADDSLHVGLDGVPLMTPPNISNFPVDMMGWSRTAMNGQVAMLEIPAPGVHTVNIWMREDGFVFDKLVLTINEDYVPTAMGPTPSPLVAVTTPGTGTNAAPVISGTPPTSVATDALYHFAPSAQDADGDTLTFSIVNQPSWATFDPVTGVLQGVPSAGDVGTTSGIRISVTDGTATAYLTAFDLVVTGSANGAALLDWVPPTTKADGSALTDLAGYRIYYGTSPGSYPNVIDVNNAGITSYVVDNLSAGAYYFVVTAYDSANNQSDYSNVASKTIP